MCAAASSDVLDRRCHDVVPRVLPHYHAWMLRYSKVFVSWTGPFPALCVGDYAMVKEILADRTGLYAKPDPGVSILALFGNGLAFINGDDWARHRRIVHSVFAMDKLKMMTKTMAEYAHVRDPGMGGSCHGGCGRWRADGADRSDPHPHTTPHPSRHSEKRRAEERKQSAGKKQGISRRPEMKSGKPTEVRILGGLRYAPPDGLVVNNALLAALIRAVYTLYMATTVLLYIFGIVTALKEYKLLVALSIIVVMQPFFILMLIATPFLRTVAIVKYAMGLPDDSNNVNRIPTGRMSALA
uniref:Cytochrome P450 n=1 Tax=Oryza glumipatula TaxID=40148 RepID=A0A0D9YDX9_9ORYZ